MGGKQPFAGFVNAQTKTAARWPLKADGRPQLAHCCGSSFELLVPRS